MKKYSSHILLVLIHIVFAIYAFWLFWKHPDGVVFCTYGDGLKNNFTFLSYVKAPITQGGIFKFDAMCYPFGDYVYYTDNTPFISIPLRFFCQHIWDISKHATALHSILAIGNIILCGLLVYVVFSYLFKEKTFSFIMALILPWTNMQLLRLGRGHYSLSYSSLVLIAILLLVLWHRNSHVRRKQYLLLVMMTLLSVAAFLFHGYLFAIVTIFMAAMLFFNGCLNFREREGKFTIIASILYLVSATVLTFLIIKATDKYLSLRQDFAMGYDWMGQKIRFSSLLSHYTYNRIYFPVASPNITRDPEVAGYLGNVGLYFLAVCGLIALMSSGFRKRILEISNGFFKDKLLASILLGSLIMLFISMGELYYTTYPNVADGFVIYNLFNPFFYVHFFTRTVEQFRSLERFVFPFYFGFYVLITYMLIAVYKTAERSLRIVIIISITFFGGSELYDNLHRQHVQVNDENLIDAFRQNEFRLPNVDMKQYQAMVPLPYFCGGSEDYDYTIDPQEDWALFTDLFILKSGLPSMSYSLSRVPPAHNIALLNCFANDSMDADMKKRMNNKPVLVMLNKNLVRNKNSNAVPSTEKKARLYWNACEFPQRNHLQAVDSFGDLVFYNWYPKP